MAFGVIVVFVLSQAAWWIVFEFRTIHQATREQLDAWQRDAQLANEVLAQAGETAGGTLSGVPNVGGGARQHAIQQRILARYPHLTFEGTLPNGHFVVDPASRASFLAAQNRHLRMFAFEGPTFALVVLSMLLLIAATLRSERELKRRQQNFLSAITHEFKTPISTLRLLVQTAQMRSLPPEKQEEYLRRMEAELDRLERTSEQVLASARLEHAENAPDFGALELNHVVQGIVGAARSGLEARGALLKVDYAPEPLPVSIDPDAFAVVLNNLLDNAVKYTPGAERPVRVKLERRGEWIDVHVDDQGVGVTEGEEERVFERFYRTGDEMTRESEGVGLGLHLVRSITEAMNGSVRAGPNPGAERGSRFTVTLPRRAASTQLERAEDGGGAATPRGAA
ncbi:MAG: HAMP domain-containing sensor histidine kinase [Deinococcales bacterium]